MGLQRTSRVSFVLFFAALPLYARVSLAADQNIGLAMLNARLFQH